MRQSSCRAAEARRGGPPPGLRPKRKRYRTRPETLLSKKDSGPGEFEYDCFAARLSSDFPVRFVTRCNSLQIVLDKTQRLGYGTTMDKKLISKVMAELGKRTSKAKAAAARENGKKGGRPPKKGKR